MRTDSQRLTDEYEPWPGYKPNLFGDLDEFLSTNRAALKNLLGKQLVQFWFPWYAPWNSRWVDGPVIVDFGGSHLEFEGSKLMCSLCWNSLDLTQPLSSAMSWANELPGIEINALCQTRLRAIRLLSFGSGDTISGLEFSLENGGVFNLFEDGDETGFAVGELSRETLFPIDFS